MSSKDPELAGQIGWIDLTVPNADTARDFYAAVIGWKPEPVDMGGYADYNMTDPDSGTPVAGVCHRRGENAALPPVWMVYFTVPNLEASIKAALENGGAIVDGPRGGFCILRDPAGAVAALVQKR